MKRLTSATDKENTRRQVERKRRFEMGMPQGGTDEIERAFESSPYVKGVYAAFKEGDDEDAVYAMRGGIAVGTTVPERDALRRVPELDGEYTPAHTHTHTHTDFTDFVSYFVSVRPG